MPRDYYTAIELWTPPQWDGFNSWLHEIYHDPWIKKEYSNLDSTYRLAEEMVDSLTGSELSQVHAIVASSDGHWLMVILRDNTTRTVERVSPVPIKLRKKYC